SVNQLVDSLNFEFGGRNLALKPHRFLLQMPQIDSQFHGLSLDHSTWFSSRRKRGDSIDNVCEFLLRVKQTCRFLTTLRICHHPCHPPLVRSATKSDCIYLFHSDLRYGDLVLPPCHHLTSFS